MCSHSEYIEDHSSGDIVCLTCGLILDRIFLSSQTKDFDYGSTYQDERLSKKSEGNGLTRKHYKFSSFNEYSFFVL